MWSVKQNINSVKLDGKWVIYGFLGGNKLNEANMGKLLAKRVNLRFTTLRTRSDDWKAELVELFKQEVLPGFVDGTLKPVIDTVLNKSEIDKAHEIMQSNQNIGKIVVNWE